MSDLQAALDATLAELAESPLPGARYAYTVVKDRMGAALAASATDEEWTAEDERRARLRDQRRAASATDEHASTSDERIGPFMRQDGNLASATDEGRVAPETELAIRLATSDRPAVPAPPLCAQCNHVEGAHPYCCTGGAGHLFARPAVPALDAQVLRLALRKEMGWSVYEVEDFLGQYNLATPLDEYDPQRLDGEYAALSEKQE